MKIDYSKAVAVLLNLLVWLIFAAIIGLAMYWGANRLIETGKTRQRLEQAQTENAAMAAANDRIVKLQSEVRQKEAVYAAAVNAIQTKFVKDLQHEKARHDSTVAALRSGALRLRIPVACPDGAGGSGTAAPGPGTVGRDGETRAELSVQASEFLVGLASEADEVVHQLTACQAVVIADRKQQGEQ